MRTNSNLVLGDWVVVVDEDAFEAALKLTKGDYQRSFVCGFEPVSGSNLRGKAREYGSSYYRSRESVLARMTAAGVPWSIMRGRNHRRLLVIGTLEPETEDQ